jgi:hypothetical protein
MEIKLLTWGTNMWKGETGKLEPKPPPLATLLIYTIRFSRFAEKLASMLIFYSIFILFSG